MDSDDRVVEYRERGDRERGERGSGSRSLEPGLRSRVERSPSPWSELDEMDYDLELKMISTPSPKKSKKMTMYADELDTHLKSIRSELPACFPFRNKNTVSKLVLFTLKTREMKQNMREYVLEKETSCSFTYFSDKGFWVSAGLQHLLNLVPPKS